MQMQPFRILGAGLRTVLSVTTMFADKPHRLNVRMRAAILCFDDLASGYRTRGWATRAAGYRAAISCVGTNRTNRTGLTMSVDRGRPEVTFQGREDRFYPVRKSAFAQTLKIAPRPPASQPSECQREI